MIERYDINLRTQYGEDFNTSIRREPDATVGNFTAIVTEETAGRVFRGILHLIIDPGVGIGANAIGTSAIGV